MRRTSNRTRKTNKCSRSYEGINMTKEELIEKIAESMCDSVDQKTLLQLYYDDSYSWLDSLSTEELLDQALYTLGEKAELDD